MNRFPRNGVRPVGVGQPADRLEVDPPLAEAPVGAVEDRQVLDRDRVPVLQAAVADLLAREVPAAPDRLDRLEGADPALGQPVEAEPAPVAALDQGEFLDPEVLGLSLELHAPILPRPGPGREGGADRRAAVRVSSDSPRCRTREPGRCPTSPSCRSSPRPEAAFPELPIVTPDPPRLSLREKYGGLYYLGIAGLAVSIAMVVDLRARALGDPRPLVGRLRPARPGRPEPERIKAAWAVARHPAANDRQRVDTRAPQGPARRWPAT